jgi:hypothetical protein
MSIGPTHENTMNTRPEWEHKAVRDRGFGCEVEGLLDGMGDQEHGRGSANHVGVHVWQDLKLVIV